MEARLTSAFATATFQPVRGSGVASSSASGEARSQGIGATPASAMRVSPPIRAAATPTCGNDQRLRSIAFRYVLASTAGSASSRISSPGSSATTSRLPSSGSR